MKPKVLVIVGPTASGKTSLSIALAKALNGEVISADSRQVYRGLDLGSGKVTKAEMDGITHHLLNIADPMNVYTAADFKRDATAAILDIQNSGRLPIIAGGTFFYINTLLGRISTPAVPPNEVLRAELETKSNEELFVVLEKLDAVRASSIDRDNPRRLVRAIEIATALGHVPVSNITSPYEVCTIGIQIDQEELHHNIHTRLLERFEAGMVKEVENLLASGVTCERLEAFGLEYRYIARYLQGHMTYEVTVHELETKIRQFAKRQMTWLKRDQTIHWVEKSELEKIKAIISEFQHN